MSPGPARAACPPALAAALLAAAGLQAGAGTEISRSADEVECHDFLELTLKTDPGAAKNPFVDATLSGEFTLDGASTCRSRPRSGSLADTAYAMSVTSRAAFRRRLPVANGPHGP